MVDCNFHGIWGGTHLHISFMLVLMFHFSFFVEILVLLFLMVSIYLHCVQVFLLHPPVRVNQGDEILVNFSMSRSEENHRLMKVDLGYKVKLSSGKTLPPVINKFYIE